MKNLFIFIIAVLGFSLVSMSQSSEKEGITKAITAGNSKALGAYLTGNVDLTVNETSGVYSKDQAEVILNRFFSDHKPSGYSIKHEGKSKLEDFYYIGDLKTAKSDYRLTFFLKKEGDKFLIKQLRIESGDE